MIKKQIVAIKELIQDKKEKMQQVLAQKSQVEDTAASNFIENMASMITLLERAMHDSNLEPYLFEPLPTQETQWFTVYPIRLEFDGMYKNLLSFLNQVLRLPYLVVVDDLVLRKKTTNDSDGLNIRVVLTIYKNKFVFSKEFIPASLDDFSISDDDRDIFSQIKARGSLHLWATQELHFLGLIKQNQKMVGIVGDPVGGVYQVMVGDKIGLNQTKIISIDKCKIVTANQLDNISRGEKCI